MKVGIFRKRNVVVRRPFRKKIRTIADIISRPRPYRALGLDKRIERLGSLSQGAPGDVVLVDADAEWTVEPQTFASKGKNTPMAGRTLRGRVVATIYGGRLAFDGRS